MDNKLIISASAGMVALIAVSGFAFSSFASDSSDSAVRGMGQGTFMGKNLSEEQKAEFEDRFKLMSEQRETRQAEAKSAIESGYGTWLEYIKAQRGEDAQILEQVNEGNFSRFQDAHTLIFGGQDTMKQGRDILENELGIERACMMSGERTCMMSGERACTGKGMGKGMGKRMGGCSQSCQNANLQ